MCDGRCKTPKGARLAELYDELVRKQHAILDEFAEERDHRTELQSENRRLKEEMDELKVRMDALEADSQADRLEIARLLQPGMRVA